MKNKNKNSALVILLTQRILSQKFDRKPLHTAKIQFRGAKSRALAQKWALFS